MSLTGLIPSFPKLTIKKNSNPNNLIWNINTNEQSTGALGRHYAQLPNVGRSSLPFNTLTVLGPEADKLDALEQPKDVSFPCGPGTIWATAWRRNAKIIIVGVDIASCLTFSSRSRGSRSMFLAITKLV